MKNLYLQKFGRLTTTLVKFFPNFYGHGCKADAVILTPYIDALRISDLVVYVLIYCLLITQADSELGMQLSGRAFALHVKGPGFDPRHLHVRFVPSLFRHRLQYEQSLYVHIKSRSNVAYTSWKLLVDPWSPQCIMPPSPGVCECLKKG